MSKDDHAVLSTSRRDKEKIKRRREDWRRQQELEMEYERLKNRKIIEWERKRAREKRNSSSLHHTGRSSPSQLTFREKLLNEKSWINLEAINYTELRKIKVDIHRNISVREPIPEIQRDIRDPDDVIIQRRDGEGCKPIFDRTEIKLRAIKDNEKKKHQSDSETNKMQTSRKRSLSPSSSNRRNRSKRYKVCEKNYTDIDEEDKRRTKRSRSKELKRNSHFRCDECEKSCKHFRKSKYTERDRNRDRNKDRDEDKDEDRDSDKYITWKDIKNCSRLLKLSLADSFHPYNFPTPIMGFPLGGNPMFPPRGFRPFAPVQGYPYPEPIRPPCPNSTTYGV